MIAQPRFPLDKAIGSISLEKLTEIGVRQVIECPVPIHMCTDDDVVGSFATVSRLVALNNVTMHRWLVEQYRFEYLNRFGFRTAAHALNYRGCSKTLPRNPISWELIHPDEAI